MVFSLYQFCFFLIGGLICCLGATSASAQDTVRVERTHPAMGTAFRIIVYAADSAQAVKEIERAFVRVDSLERIMSDYRSDSELNRLSQTAGRDTFVSVSPDLWRVLCSAQRLSRRSAGAFDVSIGPLSKLWRRAFRRQEFPDSAAVAAARDAVGYRNIELRRRDRSVRLRREGMSLDLGGIAKGYAVDAAMAVFRAGDIDRVLVDGGGDLLLGDPPPGAAGWRIASPKGEIVMHNRAIATSGDRYRYLEWAGRRYSHLIDPRTGYGVTHGSAVSVLAPTATLADALASAASILIDTRAGRRRIARIARRYRAEIRVAEPK